jgi:hypothetical protein
MTTSGSGSFIESTRISKTCPSIQFFTGNQNLQSEVLYSLLEKKLQMFKEKWAEQAMINLMRLPTPAVTMLDKLLSFLLALQQKLAEGSNNAR